MGGGKGVSDGCECDNWRAICVMVDVNYGMCADGCSHVFDSTFERNPSLRSISFYPHPHNPPRFTCTPLSLCVCDARKALALPPAATCGTWPANDRL